MPPLLAASTTLRHHTQFGQSCICGHRASHIRLDTIDLDWRPSRRFQQCGVAPILLLDDIFDKLDESRVAQIIQLVDDKHFGQLFISDTHAERTENVVKQIHQSYKVFKL